MATLLACLRAEQFEAEREDLLTRLDQCAVQGREAHILEWESRKRVEEVRALQKVKHAGTFITNR